MPHGPQKFYKKTQLGDRILSHARAYRHAKASQVNLTPSDRNKPNAAMNRGSALSCSLSLRTSRMLTSLPRTFRPPSAIWASTGGAKRLQFNLDVNGNGCLVVISKVDIKIQVCVMVHGNRKVLSSGNLQVNMKELCKICLNVNTKVDGKFVLKSRLNELTRRYSNENPRLRSRKFY